MITDNFRDKGSSQEDRELRILLSQELQFRAFRIKEKAQKLEKIINKEQREEENK